MFDKFVSFNNPLKHVDVGSRIDGFVAHLACMREVEVFDIRPQVSQIIEKGLCGSAQIADPTEERSQNGDSDDHPMHVLIGQQIGLELLLSPRKPDAHAKQDEHVRGEHGNV